MKAGIERPNSEPLINRIRDIIRQELKAAKHPKELLTIEETAELIRVSRATVYQLINDGKITPIKRGGKTVIKREHLLKWLRESAVPPKSEY